MTQSHRPAVRLERVIAAPASTLYRAWLHPDVLREWLAPGVTVARAEVDARVGGRYRIWHADRGKDVGGFESVIVELVPNERIVFRWGWTGPERTPVFDSLLTITFAPAGRGATKLTLVHERLDELAAALPHVARNVQTGWAMVLDKLAALETIR